MHRIEVSFDRDIPENTLTGLSGVTRVNRTGDKWLLTTQDKDATIRALVAVSQQNKAAIVTLNTLAPSLDEAFLRLTEGGLS